MAEALTQETLAPRSGDVQAGLEQVAGVFPALDHYYGILAAIPYGCRAVYLVKSSTVAADPGTWASVLSTGADWYGTVVPHEFIAAPTFTPLSFRARILRMFFDPFEDAAMQANCIAPLTRLIEAERAAHAAPVSPERRAQALADLRALAAWLSTHVADLQEGYRIFHRMLASVGDNKGIMDREYRRFVEWSESRNYTDDQIRAMSMLTGIKGLLERLALKMEWPIERVDLAWATVADLAKSVAGRVAAAQGQDFGSVLAQLDLVSARREWTTIAAMARGLRPGPPVLVDVAGFHVWGDLIDPATSRDVS